MRSFATVSGTAVTEYLYSQANFTTKSATLASGTLTADANGDKIVNKGAILAKITTGATSGQYGPYDTGASDGRQTLTNVVGINDSYSNLRDGDYEAGVCYAGIVRDDKVTLFESGVAKTVSTMSGSKANLKAQLSDQAAGMDIVFVDPAAL